MKTKRLWTTTIAALLLVGLIGSCKDENVETVGLCPLVISTDPANLATNVPLDQVVTVTFNEAMNPATITPDVFTLLSPGSPGGRGTAIQMSGSLSYNAANFTMTFVPSAKLAPNATYTGRVTTSVKDLMGNALQVDYVWTFSTTASPTVVSTDPVNNATNVATSKIVTATFSVPMDPLTFNAATFTLKQGTTAVAGTVSYTGSTATFTPTNPLLPSTLYTGTITTAAKNVAGSPLVANYVWTFNTGGSPSVILTDPLDLATGVAFNKVITATFSEPMDPLTITGSSFTLNVGAASVLGAVTYAGTTASFTPATNLLASTTYTATITNTVKNVGGNPITSSKVWSFTTASIPSVLSTDPIDLAIGVALNKVVGATFSEAMDGLTLTTSTFTLMNGVTPVLGTVSYVGTTATFNPSVDLLPGITYTATITTGAKSVGGIALSSDHVWTFTTSNAPTVLSTDPLNLATGVALNKVLGATFSTAMDPLTLTTSTFKLMNGATPVLGAVNYAGTTATFTPTVNLLPNVTYTATITTGAKDVGGTSLATNYVWTFTTVSATIPTVISTDPLNLATGVALNKVISATFSEAMNPLTITGSTFTLKLGATVVGGAVNYSGTTATFTPTVNLLSGSTYTATITTGAQNVGGTSLASNKVWTFSTVAPLGPPLINLNSADRFGILAGVGVSNNAGFSVINNLDVGIYPGARSSVTGFPPAIVVGGAIYASDDLAPPGTAAMLLQAQNDLTAAYNAAAGATLPAPAVAPADLGGKTLAPGIYTSASTMLLQNGDLTLDGQGDANAVWIFQVGSAFTSVGSGPFPSASGGNVILAGGAQAKNVFWQVSSSATIGDFTSFKGNVLSLSSITMNSGAVAEGRMLARNGSVVMTSTNIINKP